MMLSPKKLKQLLRSQKCFNGLSNNEIRLIILIVFPVKDADLDEYFNNARAHLMQEAVQERLHVDPDKLEHLNELIGGARNPTAVPAGTNGEPDTWNYVFPLEKNKGTFTHPLKKEKDELAVKIKATFMEIFADIPDSAITPEDTTILFIKPKSHRKKRTTTPAEINAKAYIILIPLGGGKVRVLTTTEKKSKRGKKLNRKVDIEIVWILIERKDKIPLTHVLCPNKKVLSKANEILDVGIEAGGMRLVMFARWVYVRHPKQSGGFGNGSNSIVT